MLSSVPTPPPGDERAFTLIELVVAMILAAIVIGGLVQAASLMFGSAHEQALTQKNLSNTADVIERFERDVHGAESSARTGATATRDEMRSLVLDGATTMSDGSASYVPRGARTEPCSNGQLRASSYCQFEDITFATSTRLMLRSDVVSTNATGECVSWSVESGALWRRVYAGEANCRPGSVGSLIDERRMLGAPPSAYGVASTGGSARLSYLIRYNTVAFNANTAYVEPADCATRPDVDTPTPRERAFIASATLDLSAWMTDGATAAASRTASQTRATASGALTARISDDYAYWTGCGL